MVQLQWRDDLRKLMTYYAVPMVVFLVNVWIHEAEWLRLVLFRLGRTGERETLLTLSSLVSWLLFSLFFLALMFAQRAQVQGGHLTLKDALRQALRGYLSTAARLVLQGLLAYIVLSLVELSAVPLMLIPMAGPLFLVLARVALVAYVLLAFFVYILDLIGEERIFKSVFDLIKVIRFSDFKNILMIFVLLALTFGFAEGTISGFTSLGASQLYRILTEFVKLALRIVAIGLMQIKAAEIFKRLDQTSGLSEKISE